MKKKAYALLVFVVLAAFAIGGTTYAMFTDTATNQDKTFAAGTVDIDSYRDGFDTIPGPMFYTTSAEGATPTNPSYPGLKPVGWWVPGKTVVRSLVIYNKGSLDAVLDQVGAVVQSDPANMAGQMHVAVYKIFPKYLPDGTPFAPIPGDDTLDQNALNQASNLLNPFILWADAFFNVSDFTNQVIEHNIAVNPVLLWQGSLTELTGGMKPLNQDVFLKAKPNPFIKRGALLAFVVQLDISAGNEYQGKDAKFGFTVNATQKH